MNYLKREIIKEIIKDPVAKGDLISYVSSNSNSAIIAMEDGTVYIINPSCRDDEDDMKSNISNDYKWYATICLSFIIASVVIGKLVFPDSGESWLILGICTSFLITLACHIACYLFSDAINNIRGKQ